MLLIFKIINSLFNSFITLSNELKNNINSIDGYKTIIFFKNINFSLLIEIKDQRFLLRFPSKKEKIHLLVKLTTRDCIKLLFEKKNKLRLDIIGEANIAEILFNMLNHIKSNWYSIILKKINNNYINILIRLLEITKKRVLFNKYYLKKIIYKSLIDGDIIISRYQVESFVKTNSELVQKIDLYKEKIKHLENKC